MYSDNLSFSEYSSLSQLHGSSFFVLDPFRLRANINNLRNSFLSNYYSVEVAILIRPIMLLIRILLKRARGPKLYLRWNMQLHMGWCI